MKFAAAMTLYNPDREIIDNLIRTSKCFDILYVNDNTLNNAHYQSEIRSENSVVYLWNGNNDGLPVAFNRMLSLAYKDKVDYLCTLDQDSILTQGNVNEIEEYIQNHDMSCIAAIGPSPTGTKKRCSKEIEKAEWIICSGCFLNLALLKKNNIKYDEAYFVDRFDVDICMQMRRKGLDIIQLNYVNMIHKCGDNGAHSDLRHYYMFRNRYYFNNKYYPKYIALIRTFLQNMRHFQWVYKNNIQKKQREKVYFIAVDDYRNHRLGKITNESLCKLMRQEQGKNENINIDGYRNSISSIAISVWNKEMV